MAGLLVAVVLGVVVEKKPVSLSRSGASNSFPVKRIDPPTTRKAAAMIMMVREMCIMFFFEPLAGFEPATYSFI